VSIFFRFYRTMEVNPEETSHDSNSSHAPSLLTVRSAGELLKSHPWSCDLVADYLAPPDALSFRLCCKDFNVFCIQERVVFSRQFQGSFPTPHALKWQQLPERTNVHSIVLRIRCDPISTGMSGIVAVTRGEQVIPIERIQGHAAVLSHLLLTSNKTAGTLWYAPPVGPLGACTHYLYLFCDRGVRISDLQCFVLMKPRYVRDLRGRIPDCASDSLSARVMGHYMDFGHRFAMTFHSFVLSRGHLSGLGTDEVGDFTVDGVYDVDGAFAFVKQYIGAHFVDYSGVITKSGTQLILKGRWDLSRYADAEVRTSRADAMQIIVRLPTPS